MSRKFAGNGLRDDFYQKNLLSVFWHASKNEFQFCFLDSNNCNEIFWVFNLCDSLHNLVPLVQIKKRGKHPWRSALLVKLQAFSPHLKLTLLHGWFSSFSNCTNGTKSRKTLHIHLQSKFYELDYVYSNYLQMPHKILQRSPRQYP